MSTEIQWTDETWNPTTGCTKVSPGCANCYIKQTPPFRTKGIKFVKGIIPVRQHAARLDKPLRRKKPTRYFVNSMSDLFHEDVPFEFIDRVFAVMALAPQHTFQILTKRAERMRAYLERFASGHRMVAKAARDMADPDGVGLRIAYDRERAVLEAQRKGARGGDLILPNVWLGVSVENQRFADERIPLLLQTPAAVRFISAEPLLGPVDLSKPRDVGPDDPVLDWVIVGGESGPKARPCAIEWIESVVKQCRAASVPVFVKQLGAYVVSEERTMPAGYVFSPAKLKLEHFSTQTPDEVWAWRAGLRDRKGGTPDEWPADLRVRQFPEVRA